MPRKTNRRNLCFFLRQLERTGNIAIAADCAGLAKSGIHKRKRRDPDFRRQCDAAIAAFVSSPRFRGEGDRSAKLSRGGDRHAQGVRGTAEHGDAEQRGTGKTTLGALAISRYAGRPQLRRLADGRLTGLGIANFFAALANTGNIRLAAKAVGVAHSSILARRHSDPAFAAEMAAALEVARTNLECALIQAADRTFAPDWEGGIDPDGPKMTVGQMLRFLEVRQRRER